jgi:hypothetical protein
VEQETPGGQSRNLMRWKGIGAMVNYVFNKMIKFRPVALVVIGWLAFIAGQAIQSFSLKLVLLMAARVLPQMLYLESKHLY